MSCKCTPDKLPETPGSSGHLPAHSPAANSQLWSHALCQKDTPASACSYVMRQQLWGLCSVPEPFMLSHNGTLFSLYPCQAQKKKKKTYRVHLGSINICCSWQGTEIALRQNQDAQGWRAVGLEWTMYGKKATYSGKGVAYLSCSAIQLPVFSNVNPNTWDKEGK